MSLFPDKRIMAEDIASEIGVTVRHFKERTSKQPDFPRPFKIGNTRVWMEKEVKSWILKQRER